MTPTAQAELRATKPQPSVRTSLSLLDAFELRCDGELVGLPVSAQRLLAFLALHERPLLRPYVAGTLWIDASDERAGASLRSSLWRLNRSGHRLVDATSTRLGLAPGIDVDVRSSLALARRLLDGTAPAAELDSAEASLNGEVLPDWYDDWLVFERERFRQLSLHALEVLSDRLLAAGRLGGALGAALAAVRGEPLRESSHRALIRVHLAEGNRAEALRQRELCRRLLRERLGAEPSPQLDELLRT
ncbi:MAG TPA: BTAD domain-containing putative transcriptional regulator [Gaiellaceae bacterium]|nr:BTAD domain-containing putative transcriptional regulator [Gaiellaceae bacterium]